MSNKVTSKSVSRLLDHKLDAILKILNTDIQQQNIVEREIMLSKFTEIINKFYKTLSSPLLSTDKFRAGTFADYSVLNKRFREVEQDLVILYKELNSMESFLISNYNTLNTQATALRGRLRRAASKLGDLRLYAKDNLGGATYFSDSFQTTDNIDYDKKLYDEKVCSIDLMAGDISLPINTGKTKTYEIEEITIGSGSNGISGNNQEVNALYRGELKSISDSNPDTWFEYERVSDESSSIPLIMELKFKLDKDSIINIINFSSTSFATRKYPRITKIEVSLDDKEYTNIIDQVPSSSFFEEDSKKVILLNPAAGKFSGVSKIKIPPNKARYIKLVIQQDDAYLIKTPSGIKYRKAIGIRDVEIVGEVYETVGELVSKNFTAQDEIKKVSLITNSITKERLTDVRHMVSIDNGQNWHEIQPVDKISKDIKEILNFNLEEADSIKSSNPSNTIRHKAILERKSNGFSSKGGIEKKRESTSEFRSIGAGSQSISLKNRPVANTVKIKNVSYGSVGGDSFYLIGKQEMVVKDDFTYVHLPHLPFAQNSISKDSEIIKVGEDIWKRVDDLMIAGNSDRVYEFDYINNIIKFGDDTTGKKPDSSIFFKLKREQVLINNDAPKKIFPIFNFDGVKETTKVYRLLDIAKKEDHTLPKQSRIHRLNLTDIDHITIVADPAGVLQNEIDFVNGSSELSANGDFSIDKNHGIIYTYKETSLVDDTKINIFYNPREEITDITIKEKHIEIPNDKYIVEKEKKTITLNSGTKTIGLSECVEPRSIKFLSLVDNFKTEVPFKGDGSEFDIGLTPAELDGYYTVDYKNGVIYTYNSISGTLILEYNTSSYYIEYNIAVDIARDDFEIKEEDNEIILSNRYIIQTFSNSLDNTNLRSLFKIDYDYVVELKQNPKELEPYYTPVLKDYALAILTKRQL